MSQPSLEESGKMSDEESRRELESSDLWPSRVCAGRHGRNESTSRPKHSRTSETHTRTIPTLFQEASEDMKYFTQGRLMEKTTYDSHGHELQTVHPNQNKTATVHPSKLKTLTFLRPRKLGMCFPEARLKGRREGGGKYTNAVMPDYIRPALCAPMRARDWIPRDTHPPPSSR